MMHLRCPAALLLISSLWSSAAGASAEPPKVPAPTRPGKLLLCGGALGFQPLNTRIFNVLLREARLAAPGVDKPKIVGITSASASSKSGKLAWSVSTPDEESYAESFAKMGLTPVHVPLGIDNYAGKSYLPEITEAGVAKDRRWIDAVGTAAVIFLNGGYQSRHYRALKQDDGKDAPLMAAVRAAHARGALVMGTSAGTHAQSEPMYSSGSPAHSLLTGRPVYFATRRDQLGPVRYDRRKSSVEDGYVMDKAGFVVDQTTGERSMIYPHLDSPLDPDGGAVGHGLGLWPGVMLDTHFDQRGRLARLAVALAAARQRPEYAGLYVGIGVDENTCLLWDPQTRRGRVVGENGVWVVDFSRAAVKTVNDGRPVVANGIEVSYLTDDDAGGDELVLDGSSRLAEVVSHKAPVAVASPAAGGVPATAGANTSVYKDILSSGGTGRALRQMVGERRPYLIGLVNDAQGKETQARLSFALAKATKVYQATVRLIGAKGAYERVDQVTVDRVIMSLNDASAK